MVGIFGLFCSFGFVGRCVLVLVLGAAFGLGCGLGVRLAVRLATVGSLL